MEHGVFRREQRHLLLPASPGPGPWATQGLTLPNLAADAALVGTTGSRNPEHEATSLLFPPTTPSVALSWRFPVHVLEQGCKQGQS